MTDDFILAALANHDKAMARGVPSRRERDLAAAVRLLLDAQASDIQPKKKFRKRGIR